MPSVRFANFTGRGSVLSGGVDSGLEVSGTTTGASIYAYGLLLPNGLSPILNDTSSSSHTVVPPGTCRNTPSWRRPTPMRPERTIWSRT